VASDGSFCIAASDSSASAICRALQTAATFRNCDGCKK
jgi:hypothetical protein